MKKSNSKRWPRVSVGLAVYNGEKLVKRAIECWLSQELDDLELIISDNGSTDKTESICRSYQEKDPRINYYRYQDNMGQVRSFSRLFEMARGDYFVLAFHNDFFDRSYLKTCVTVLDNDSSAVLCYSGTHLVREDGRFVADVTDKFRLDQEDPTERYMQLLSKLDLCNCYHGVVRTEAAQKMVPIDCCPGADVAYLAKLTLRGKFIQVNAPLCFRNLPAHTAWRTLTDRYRYIEKLAFPHMPFADLTTLPFTELIGILVDYVSKTDFPDETKDNLIKITYDIMLQRYRNQIMAECENIMQAIKKGHIRHIWKDNGFNKQVSDIHRHLRNCYLLKRLRDVDILLNFADGIPDLHLAAGFLLSNLGRLAEAKVRIESTLRLDPHNDEARKLMDVVDRALSKA